MSTFVFRNNTIEPFFPANDYNFSGYDDISRIPSDAEDFMWFYQIPLDPVSEHLAEEIKSYAEKLNYVASQIPKEKKFIVFTISQNFFDNVINSDNKIARAVIDFNDSAYELASDRHNVKIIDICDFTCRYSYSELIDWKYWFVSQMPYNPKLAKPFKKWLNGKIRAVEMKRKKCLVLDLDNTLWGGILGEEGIEGIKIGGAYPGKAFAWWQKSLIVLSNAGIILTVCSKNNEADVIEAWEKNPFVILKDNYISAYRINWKDKASNVQELAKELNIGLDSMVFVDDNPTERELVRQALPMVQVPDFPSQPYLLPDFFKSLINDYFQVYSLTSEDQKKTEQYKANANRAKSQQTFHNFEDFLKSLNIKISIEEANDYNLPRISQMTQKTNQFNLTTKRYEEEELRKFIKAGWKIWCISVSDKFGDNGITGCIFVDNDWHIDTLLLSCRILGKGIEYAFVQSILNKLKEDGVSRITSRYIPTKKNLQVSDFYDKCGFELSSEGNGVKDYYVDLEAYAPETKEYYNIIFK